MGSTSSTTTGSDRSAGSVVLDYVAAQTAVLRHQDPLVRLDREDAVHQMRVAARRLRSALQTFRRLLDRERSRAVSAELRWFAGELAPARDTEVMHARLAELLDDVLAELPGTLVAPGLRADLDAEFDRRAAHARTRALAALESARYRALLVALDGFAVDPPLRGRARRDAGHVLPAAVDRAHHRVATAMAAALDVEPGAHRDEVLHEARKAAKRLRYAHEAARPALGARARRGAKRMTTVQDLLGVHQDSVVMRATVRELATGRRDGFALGLVYGAEAVRAREVESALPAAWARSMR